MKYSSTTIVNAIFLFLLLIVLELCFTMLIYHFFPNADMQNGVQVAIDVSLLTAYIIGVWAFKGNRILASKRHLNFKEVLLYLSIAVVWVYISPIAKYPFLSYHLTISEISFSLEKFNSLWEGGSFSYYYILRLLFITPVLEELFFRKLLLSNLNSKYGAYKAVLFTSLLFSISHLDVNNQLVFFVGSIILSILFLRTNDIRYCIALHVFMNLVTLMLR